MRSCCHGNKANRTTFSKLESSAILSWTAQVLCYPVGWSTLRWYCESLCFSVLAFACIHCIHKQCARSPWCVRILLLIYTKNHFQNEFAETVIWIPTFQITLKTIQRNRIICIQSETRGESALVGIYGKYNSANQWATDELVNNIPTAVFSGGTPEE